MFVTRDPLGNPVDQRHPWNQHTIPGRRSGTSTTSTAGSCRPAGTTARTTWRRHRRRADRAAVGHRPGQPGRLRLRQGHRPQRADQPAADRDQARGDLRMEGADRQDRGAAVQRDRARPGPDLLPGLLRGLRGVLRGEGAGRDPGRPDQDMGAVQRGPTRRTAAGSPRRSACPVAPHGDPGREDRQLSPYPPTPWNASVRDSYGTPGPYEDAVQNTPIFEENAPENFKGIDIMRTVRSFDPCLPCGCTCTWAAATR